MTLLEELKAFVKHILYWVFSLAFSSFFFFLFGLKEAVILGKNVTLPLPTENSFSVMVFNKITHDLLPPGVQLVVTNPLSAFVSHILLSVSLGFLVTMPLLIYKFILYIQPALLPQEKKAVLLSLLPIISLFFLGSLFSYLHLIPVTFKVLYPYATIIGAVPFFSIDEFIFYVFGLILVVGVMFLLPVFMILLSVMGIIRANFWGRKWRYACLFFLILSAIITPDGTGITMAMLFFPLAVLYLAGYILAVKLSKRT